MSLVSIRSTIKTTLDALSGSGQPLNGVFDYYNPEPAQFPVACITFTGARDIRIDNAQNELTGQFTLTFLFDAESSSDIESQIVTMTDTILDEFRKRTNADTLGGTVHRLNIIDVKPIVAEDNAAPMIGFDIILEASIMKLLTN